MTAESLDARVRLAAFHFLDEQTRIHGEVLPGSLLRAGFPFGGDRVRLMGQPGIWKPAILPEIPLSITTTFEGPYQDQIEAEGLVSYKYCGTDPQRWDNKALRLAMKLHVPLVYFHAIEEGRYFAAWPVFIVDDHPESLAFSVAVDESRQALLGTAQGEDELVEGRRAYVTRLTKQRVHQQKFSAQVLAAYHERCAICRLHHRELLDAAHILPDGHPRGEPIVPNGMALCKLHHGAFDKYLLGIRPDLVIEIRRDILDEEDGPMLVHGLQGFRDKRIQVPRRDELRPRRDFLEERYALFRKAG